MKERKYFRFYGIFKREKHANDLRQTSRVAKQMGQKRNGILK